MKKLVLKGSVVKSAIPNCPGCGRPRGKGDLSHGRCMEKVAKQELKGKGEKVKVFKDGRYISQEAKRKSKNNAAKRFYNPENLPDYMFS